MPPMAAPPIPPPHHGGLAPTSRSNLPLILVLVAVVLTGAGGWFGYQWWQKTRTQTGDAGKAAVTSAPVETAQSNAPAPPPGGQPVEQSGRQPVDQPFPPVMDSTPPSRSGSTAPPQRSTTTAASAPVAAEQPVDRPAPEPPAEKPIYATPAPVQTAPASEPPATPPPSRTPVFRPEPTYQPPAAASPAAPRYSGPASGVIVWSGRLEQGASVTIEGDRASAGTVNGALPGVPVLIEITPADVGIAEAPGPGNGWNRLSVRSRKNRHTVVTIRWRVL